MVHDISTVKSAVLIDANNEQPSISNLVLRELAKYGTAFVNRAYGDWTSPQLSGWREHLLENSIQPMQQFAPKERMQHMRSWWLMLWSCYTLSGLVGFVLFPAMATSQYSPLGFMSPVCWCMGVGNAKLPTPKSFVTACDKFFYAENVQPKSDLVREVDAKQGWHGSV